MTLNALTETRCLKQTYWVLIHVASTIIAIWVSFHVVSTIKAIWVSSHVASTIRAI